MFRNTVLFLILLAMVGLPVIYGVRGMMQKRYTPAEQIVIEMVAMNERLPMQVYEHMIADKVEFEDGIFSYFYTVDISPEKLMAMTSVLSRMTTRKLCRQPIKMDRLRRFGYKIVEKYRVTAETDYKLEISFNSNICPPANTVGGVTRITLNPAEGAGLGAEYMRHFLPIQISDDIQWVDLEMVSTATILVLKVDNYDDVFEDPKKFTPKILEAICDNYEVQGVILLSNLKKGSSLHYGMATDSCEMGEMEFDYDQMPLGYPSIWRGGSPDLQ